MGGVRPQRPPTWAGSCAGPPVSECVVPSFYLPRNGLERYDEAPNVFSFIRKGSERNSELSLASAEWLGTEFRAFSVPRNRRNSEGMIKFSVCSMFRGIIFFSENSNPSRKLKSRYGARNRFQEPSLESSREAT